MSTIIIFTNNTFDYLIRIRLICTHVKVKVAQLCLTLCDPMNYTVHGIFLG